MTLIYRLQAFLRTKGINSTVELSEDECTSDHELKLSGGMHIQVASYGDSYMCVVVQEGEDFIFYPERLTFQDVYVDMLKARAR